MQNDNNYRSARNRETAAAEIINLDRKPVETHKNVPLSRKVGWQAGELVKGCCWGLIGGGNGMMGG